MSDYILELKDIVKRFSGVVALNHVQFQLKKGEIHALMGENGAGKSTFIKVITGVHAPDEGEIILKGMHISPYEQGNIFNKDPRRPRRLLAHKSEIRHLQQQIKLQGYTLVPLQLYFKQGRVKVELGLCKGKKLYDKRADAAARDAKRDIDRAIKTRR